jgi:hypothetical protein
MSINSKGKTGFLTVPLRKSTWGPALWKTLHGLGKWLGEIKEKDERCKKTREAWEFTKTLLESIPCPECKAHALIEYKSTLYQDPVETMEKWYQVWVFVFHNKVNKRIHKRALSWEESEELVKEMDPIKYFDSYYKSINGWRIQRIKIFFSVFDNFLKSLKS